jgi:hypothetical protein
VHAVATGGADDQSSIEVETNNPPVTPAGVSVRATDDGVGLTWSANPEPDLIEYVVERDSGSGYVVVGEVESNKFAEDLVAGHYAYRVTAVRSSPVDADGISSVPSEPAAFTIASSAAGGDAAVTKLEGSHPLGRGGGLPRNGRSASGLAALLGGSALPSAGKLPAIPSSAGIPWGTYNPELPYGDDDAAAAPPGLRSRPVSASGPLSVIPPDGLRWVAAGLLLLVVAGLSQVLAVSDLDVPRPLVDLRSAARRWFVSSKA